MSVESGRKCSLAQSARRRFEAAPHLLRADWHHVVLLHFALPPDLLARHVPAPLELELYQGMACISLVNVTMRRFRGTHRYSPFHWLCPLLRQQHFLNVRTYVRHRDEPGALFFQGWLSRPWKGPVPSGLLGLPYTFASVQCDQAATSPLSAHIVDATGNRFAYQAEGPAAENLAPCPAGSVAEFTLERYSGFFVRAGRVMGFRIWHPAWLQATLAVSIIDDALIRSRFEWFKQAKFLGANYAPGFPAVSIGRPQRIERMRAASVRRRHVLSSFYEMP